MKIELFTINFGIRENNENRTNNVRDTPSHWCRPDREVFCYPCNPFCVPDDMCQPCPCHPIYNCTPYCDPGPDCYPCNP